MVRLLCAVLACLVAAAPPGAAAEPDERSPAMLEPVFAAIRADDGAELARLLDADASLAGMRDAAGLSPLSLAAYMERPALVEIVKARRGTPDFFEACILGDEEAVRAALAGGQDVDAFAPDGFTALGLAAFFRHPELARLLLEAGADPGLQARNAQRVGPIHAAVTRGDLATLERLLLAGADADAPQTAGVRPIHVAAANGSLAGVALLLMFGADPAARTEEGRSAAEFARERGHGGVADALDRLTAP